MIYQDFLTDADTGDLQFSLDGDLVIGPSDKKHITDIVTAFPGWYKNYPQVGVGIMQYSGSDGREQEIARSIRIQLEADGYTVNNPNVTLSSAGQMLIAPNAFRQ